VIPGGYCRRATSRLALVLIRQGTAVRRFASMLTLSTLVGSYPSPEQAGARMEPALLRGSHMLPVIVTPVVDETGLGHNCRAQAEDHRRTPAGLRRARPGRPGPPTPGPPAGKRLRQPQAARRSRSAPRPRPAAGGRPWSGRPALALRAT